jgi:GNAT superfamily N-acetyltransferase
VTSGAGLGAGARPAGIEDVATMAELVDVAVAEQADGRGGAVWALRETRPRPAADSLAAAVEAEDHLAVVGTYDGTAVGHAIAHHEDLRGGDRLGVLDDIFVLPEARGVGVGEAMIELVLDWSRAAGCRGVDGLALPGNRATKNFFETFGFTARAIIVHRDLDRDP